jgi:hypothetical protein
MRMKKAARGILLLAGLSGCASNRKQAIGMAWEHGGPDFRARFDKSTGQAQEMKEGALRVL